MAKTSRQGKIAYDQTSFFKAENSVVLEKSASGAVVGLNADSKNGPSRTW